MPLKPKRLIKAKMKVENDQLQVEGCTFDLRNFKNVYVVGGGKAGGKMAQAIEELLGNHYNRRSRKHSLWYKPKNQSYRTQ